MDVSVFLNIKQTKSPPSRVNVLKVLERIRNGENGLKKTIEDIRKGVEEKYHLKANLGAVIFSGYCGKGVERTSSKTKKKYISYRDDSSLSEHSGLCVIDLDKIGSSLLEWKNYFKELKYVFSVFISPSGDGLKVLYRIPPDIKMHRSHYASILKDIEQAGLKVDSTSINETRVCFISYDPDIYINTSAVEYRDFLVLKETDQSPVLSKKGNGLTDFRKLSVAAEMIDNAVDGEKHKTLIKASYLMGGYVESGIVSEPDARNMLRERIKHKNPRDLSLAFDTIEDGLKKGKLKPIYEIEGLEKEFNQHLLRNKYKSEKRGFDFLIDNKEVDEKIMSIMLNGIEMGVPVGIETLDNYFRVKENNFSVFLGHDNVGKSSIVWWISVVVAAKYDWKWIIYSPENDIAKIKIKLMEFVLGGRLKGEGKQPLDKAKEFVDNHFYFIRKDRIYSLFDIIEHSKVLCFSDNNIKGLLIDPYNSLSLDYKNKGAGLSSYEYHTRAISELRIFAETHCTVYVNAHSITEARRLSPNDSGDIPRPYKSHIDGGAVWANRCDDFYVIHRQVKNMEKWMFTELHVDKIKDTDTGGDVTRGDDEAVKLLFYNNVDFVDPSNKKSPLTEWRNNFFGIGVQQKIPLGDIASAF